MKFDSLVEENVFAILKENNIAYNLLEHEPVYTCEAAAALACHSLDSGIKSIIMMMKPSREFFLLCLPGSKRVDSKKVLKATGAKKIRFATPDEVKVLTGLDIGCCCPFGYEKDFKKYYDKELFMQDYLFFNPGSHRRTIKIKSSDLKKITTGVFI